jgi:hypothetical protein
MDVIRHYNRSGKLLSWGFYVLSVPLDVDLDLRYASEDTSEWIVRRSPIPENDEAYAEVCAKCLVHNDCSLDSSHCTGVDDIGVHWTDLYGGSRVADFVPDKTSGSIVVTTKAAELLRGSGLKGLDAMALPIRVDQSGLGEVPLSRLLFQGKACERQSRITPPEPNQCPFCGWGPVVCPECKTIAYHCRGCERKLVRFSASVGSEPFMAEPYHDGDAIIEADAWDGCDFIVGKIWPIVTKRVVRWLLRHDFAPFVAKPCAVNVERVDDSHRKIIEEICEQPLKS